MLVPLLLVGALPIAEAQVADGIVLEIEVDEAEGPLPPNDFTDLKARVNVACEPVAASRLAPISIVVLVENQDPWVQVSVSPSTHTFHADECLEKSHVIETTITVGTRAEEPAGAPVPIEVSARAEGAEDATHEWQERVGVYMRTQAETEQEVWQAGANERLEIPVDIANKGNDDIIAAIRKGQNTTDGINMALPAPVTIAAGENATVLIDVQTPFENGYTEERDVLELIVETRSVTYVNESQTHVLTVAVETEGAFLPAPAPVLLLVALGMLLHRLRRR